MTTTQTHVFKCIRFSIFFFGDVSILATGITKLYEFIEKGIKGYVGLTKNVILHYSNWMIRFLRIQYQF